MKQIFKNLFFIIILLYLIYFIISLLRKNITYSFGKGYELVEDPELQYEIVNIRVDTFFYDSDSILRKGILVIMHYPDSVDTGFLVQGGSLISSYINQVVADNHFILVDQKPLDSIFGKYHTDQYGVYAREKEPGYTDAFVKMLKESNRHCYWIIDKRTDEIYGPLKMEEFQLKCKELNVPEYLQLRKDSITKRSKLYWFYQRIQGFPCIYNIYTKLYD